MVFTTEQKPSSGALDVTKAHISPKISIIIPAYNEEGTLPTILSEISRLNLNTEVIVADAGSVDGTPQIAKELGVEVIERKIGLGDALRTGFDFAMRGGADIIVIIDADGQYPPLMIPRLIEPLISGSADVVLGSRFEHMHTSQKLFTTIFSLFIRLFTPVKVMDPNTIFRAYKTTALKELALESKGSFILPELTIKAANADLRTIEIPVSQRPRIVRYPKLSASMWLVEVVRNWLRILRKLF